MHRLQKVMEEEHGLTGCDFVLIARGSLSETLNHLIDALDENYINHEQLNYYRNKITDVEKLLNGYINYLEKKSEE